jgi:hemin uptake protein HemP
MTMQSPARPIPTHDARDLTAGQVLAQITLDTQVYTLRITKSGKLILTK